MTQTASVEQAKQQLKLLKQQQGEISGQFKRFAKGSAEQLALRPQMQAISAQVKQLQAEIKLAQKRQTAANEQPATPSMPAYFQPLTQRYQPEQLTFSSHHLHLKHPKHDEVWQQWFRFCQSHPKASVYHQQAIHDSILQAFGLDCSLLIARDPQGQIVGGLPLYTLSSKLFGRFAISVPYFNYGGPVCDCSQVATRLIEQARSLLSTEQLERIEVRCVQPELGEQPSDKKVSMLLALPSDIQRLEQQLGAKVRAQYNKADEHNLRVAFGGLELLDDYYRVFSENMRDLGTPVYGKAWFRTLLEQDSLKPTLVCVYHHNKPVATAFLIGFNEVLEIPWASTLRSANNLNANMWMYRQVLGFAIEQGYNYFDFGRSTRDAGTYRFKKQWGAKAYPHYWYTLSEQQQAAELNPDNPKYALMIKVWQRMPVVLTQLLGPHIVRHIG